MNKYKLRDLLSIKNGKDYKHLEQGNYPVYGTGGVMTYVNDYLYDGESILLPRKGTLDNIMFVSGRFWTVDTMYWSIVNESIVYPKYLYCYLSLLDLSCRDSGSTLPSMTFDSYYNLDIYLPDLEEQNKIADKVFAINQKLENNNKINQKLESFAKTLYDYWFLQFEFPNEEDKPYKSSGGKMVWNEELKREIPEGWETMRFGDITSFVKGKIPQYELTPTKNELNDNPYITIDVANNALPMFCCSKDMVPVNGETIMVMDGAASGDVYIGNEGVLGSTFAKISSTRNDISDAFLYMLLKSNSIIYKKANAGSTVPHANTNFIKAMRIALPKDCSRMSKEFDIIMNAIKNIRIQNQQLSSLRDWLLPMLMNGQVTFKDEK